MKAPSATDMTSTICRAVASDCSASTCHHIVTSSQHISVGHRVSGTTNAVAHLETGNVNSPVLRVLIHFKHNRGNRVKTNPFPNPLPIQLLVLIRLLSHSDLRCPVLGGHSIVHFVRIKNQTQLPKLSEPASSPMRAHLGFDVVYHIRGILALLQILGLPFQMHQRLWLVLRSTSLSAPGKKDRRRNEELNRP